MLPVSDSEMSRSAEYRETPPLGLRPSKPVTLPSLKLPALDAELDTKEAAERAAITRTIRLGRDCWKRIGDANSFTAWCRIGAALHIGKTHALRTTGANCAWGSTYSRAFNTWMNEYGFGAMRASDRSHAIDLHENLEAIEQWRATLPDKQRRRLQGPQQNVRRWRRETQQNAKPRRDDIARALAAWQRFVACVSALPADQAAPLWQTVQAQAATAITG
jgi:hypothetical protein